MDSDSDGEGDMYKALCMAYAPLDRASNNPDTKRMMPVNSVELEAAARCGSSRPGCEANFECTDFVPIVQHEGNFDKADFVAVVSQDALEIEQGLALGVARLRPQRFRRLSRPAISGSVLPQERCASLCSVGNSCAAAGVGSACEEKGCRHKFICRQRGSAGFPPLLRTNAMHTHKCRSEHMCIAMLPHMLAHVPMGESDRCAGSSPL